MVLAILSLIRALGSSALESEGIGKNPGQELLAPLLLWCAEHQAHIHRPPFYGKGNP
jgi:hypothetical protein